MSGRMIFASDYDGTLSQNGGISERTLAAIADFRAAGGLFGVVTGRSVGGSEFLFDAVSAGLDFVLCGNGAVFIAPDKSRSAFREYPAAVMRDMWRFACDASSSGLGPQSVDESLWIETSDPAGGEKVEGFISRHDRVFQCNMAFRTSEDAAFAAGAINERFGDTVHALQNGGSVDIPGAGVDKAYGVRRLAGIFGVDGDALFAAGDQMNDYAMVAAFRGFAMEHAPEKLRLAARHTVREVGDALEMIMRGDFKE